MHLFKQLKNNGTFLDVPAIAFYPSALAAAWQLFPWFQNKSTLWKKKKKANKKTTTAKTTEASLLVYRMIDFGCMKTEAGVLIR